MKAMLRYLMLPRVVALVGIVLGSALATPAAARDKDANYWVEPMKKVHAKFTGTRGTFAQFGDSITVTMAYWAPLQREPKNMSPEMAKAYQRVKAYMVPECWNKWKGADYGSTGSMTIRWADDNVDQWLKRHNPDVALIMFGTNDIGQLDLKDYQQKTRQVVQCCLDNGTVVILSTIPPRSGRPEASCQFAAAVRRMAERLRVPLVDYFQEVLKRRPDDWDGSLAKFKDAAGDEYQVPTLIARDGVHPSNPRKYQDYSEESLRSNGYVLRNYLTLRSYAEVIERVLQSRK